MKEVIHWIDQLTNSSHIGILVVDKERNNLFVNDRISEMFGYTKEELLETNAEIFHTNHDTFLRFADIAFEAVLAGNPLGVDYEFKRKDGSLFWIHIAGDPIQGKEEVLWTMVDITLRIEAKKKENELKERLTLALLGNSDAIWDFDLLSGEVYYSTRWREMLGYTKDELINETQIWNESVHVEDKEKVLQEIEHHIEGKSNFIDIEHRIKHKNGHWVWLHIRAKAIFDKKGTATRLIGTNTDITEHKNIQLKTSHLAQMIEQTHDSVISTDLEGNILTWNRGSQKLFGYTQEEALSQNVSFLYPPEKFDVFLQNVEILMKNGEFFSDAEVITKDREYRTTSLSLSLLYAEDGSPSGMVGYSKDITEKKEAQKRLEESNYNLQVYLDAIDKIGIGLFVVNEDFTVRYMNQTLKGWFGDQTGKTCYSSVAGLNDPCPYCKLHEVIHENKKVIYEPTTDKGNSFEIVATSIKNSDGTTSKMEFIRDITDQKKAQENLLQEKEKLAYQAHHDSLTGLPNRILFNDRLTIALQNAKRSKTKIALLFIDLDHFKEINDSLGHDVGDKILKTVTKRLQETLRNKDTLARLGGDEFTIILEDLIEVQDASIISSKILEILSEVIEIDENRLYVSSSIGISIYPDDGHSTQNLLKFADSAMYKAKDEGRNNYQYYNAKMTEIAFERVVMEASLREALKKEEFVVYYQPQVDGLTDKLIGMEALVRWNHPTMGLVSPAKFISLAETTGLIIELDRFVMRTAMTQLAQWYKRGYKPGVLALNLAIKQLQQKDFTKMIHSLLESTGCKPEWVELEVTESQIMRDPEQAISQLQYISDLGIKLAVDDFGTGYSSLAYLKRLPIDKLKIDQAFIQNIPDDEEDVAIARAVIALASSLNLNIIAEGVETQKQKDFIVNNGCRNIQGYFYSKPIPAEDIEKILKTGDLK